MAHRDHPQTVQRTCAFWPEEGRAPSGTGGRHALLHGGSRPHLARERDLADEGGALGGGQAGGGRGQRGGDGQVAGRIVDPDAARHGSEQLRASEREPDRALEHRRDLLEPPEVEPGHLTPAGAIAAADQCLDLHRQRPAPGQRQGDRGAGVAFSGAQQGGRGDRRQPPPPAGPISNHAVSPSALNRFLPPETIRSPDRGSPSKVRTTSTACSRARGPARSPSLVTCPDTTTVTSSVLASSTRASTHPRTCATPPGCVVASGSRSVWIESTARTVGRSARAAAITA